MGEKQGSNRDLKYADGQVFQFISKILLRSLHLEINSALEFRRGSGSAVAMCIYIYVYT